MRETAPPGSSVDSSMACCGFGRAGAVTGANHQTTQQHSGAACPDMGGSGAAPGLDLTQLGACTYCAAVYRRTVLAEGEQALCRRCGSPLYREKTRAYRHLLPLVVTALILFFMSNAYPIVALEIHGIRLQTTLWGALAALYTDHMVLVALPVFATTLLFPLAEMLMLLYVLVPMALHRRPAGFARIVHGIQQARPWGMLEVFLLGVLVTLVKLSSMAEVLPGVALWSFGALVVVLSAILSFAPHDLWQYLIQEPPR